MDELTAFVQEAILVLNEELKDSYITEQEQEDYIVLFLMAADHVLRNHDELRKEVHNMLETKIKLPSVMIRELKEEIANQKERLADQKEQIADKDAKIQHLEELLSRLTAEKQ